MSELIDTTEMYLRTVFELEEEGTPPMRARIAERRDGTGVVGRILGAHLGEEAGETRAIGACLKIETGRAFRGGWAGEAHGCLILARGGG